MNPADTKLKLLTDELKKCIDPFYFIENYVFISHPKHGVLKFKMYDYQRNLIASFIRNRFNIILKARQLGISTVVAAYALHRALFKSNQNILICATKLDTAKSILYTIRMMHKRLPKIFSYFNECVSNSVTVLGFSNGSIIHSATTTEDLGRSQALSLLIVDEAAWVRKPHSLDKIWASLRPTLATGGDCVLISTPNGIGNKFYELYKEAEEGKNEFVAHKLMWYLRYDKDWFEKECKDKTPREIAQEYCCEFLGSSANVIPIDKITQIQKDVTINSSLIDTVNEDYVNIYKDGNKENSLNVMFCDVSRGENAVDYSAFNIIDIVNKQQIVDFKAKIDLYRYANIAVKYSFIYNAPILIENNGVGQALITSIMTLYNQNKNAKIIINGESHNIADVKIICETHYKNISELFESLIDYNTFNIIEEELDVNDFNFYFYSDDLKKSYVAVPLSLLDFFCRATNAVKGFTVSGKSRDMEITAIVNMITKRKVEIRLPRIIEELYTFVWKGNRAAADNNCHDDLIMSFALGCLFISEMEKNVDLDFSTAYLTGKPEIIESTVDNVSVESKKFDSPTNNNNNKFKKEKEEFIKNKWLLE